MSRPRIDSDHPQREEFSRWLKREGIDPFRVRSVTFNGSSTRTARTVEIVWVRHDGDGLPSAVRGSDGSWIVATELRSHTIRHRPPKILEELRESAVLGEADSDRPTDSTEPERQDSLNRAP